MRESIECWTNRYDVLKSHLTSKEEPALERIRGANAEMVAYHYNECTVVTDYNMRNCPFNLKITAISERQEKARETLAMLRGVLEHQ
jgi:hypothetical protein